MHVLRAFPFHCRYDACVHIYTAGGWDVTAARTYDRSIDVVSTSHRRYRTRPPHGRWPLCNRDNVRGLAVALATTIFIDVLTVVGRARVTCAPFFTAVPMPARVHVIQQLAVM